MKFEGIFAISVRGEFVHIFGYVDDFDGSEWAFFNADTASDAKYFRNVADG